VLLFKVILFKYHRLEIILDVLKQINLSNFKFRITTSNFIPMKTMLYYLGGNQSVIVAKNNLLGNIIAFGPLGFLLPIAISKMNKLKQIFVISAAFSLILEVVQLITGLGQFDVDDIILNVLGSILGFIIYKTIKGIFYKKSSIFIE
jgi:glycopeptide antibiotics resistance protein